jgi:hypothetical protein
LASVALAVTLVLLVALLSKVPPMRVYFPVVSFPLSLVLLFIRPRLSAERIETVGAETQISTTLAPTSTSRWRIERPASRGGQLILALLVVGLFMGVHKQMRRSVISHRIQADLQAWIAGAKANCDKLHIVWGGALPVESISPLDSLDDWNELRFLSLCWSTWAPWSEQTKRDRGFTRVAEALHQRDDLVLVACPYDVLICQQFVAEHHGVTVELIPSQAEQKVAQAGRLLPREQVASRVENANALR